MTNAYVYQAALLCEACGEAARAQIGNAGAPAGIDPREDSDAWPQGPYSDGGGEADTPQHCDHCQAFLGNPLTDEGRRYVVEALARGDGAADVLTEWRDFYGDQWSLDGHDVDRFVDAYIECALWAECHSASGEGDDSVPFDQIEADLSSDAHDAMERDCRDFLEQDRALELVLLACDRPGYDITRAGHDLWLTRNGHGAGFWDRGLDWIGAELTKLAKSAGSRDLYLGDDGEIHQSP